MTFTVDRITTPGDLVKLIWDAPFSATIAHHGRDILLSASAHLASPKPVAQAWWMTGGRNLRRVWDRGELHRLKRELREHGRLEDYRYRAYTWSLGDDGQPVRVPAKFVAASVEVIQFGGAVCRVMYGVAIDD